MIEFITGVIFSFIGVGIYTYMKDRNIENRKIKFKKKYYKKYLKDEKKIQDKGSKTD